MLSSDAAVWENTVNNEPVPKPFVDKDMLYIQDQNNGSYSGQIQIDCSSLANNNRWLNYQEAYLEVPFVISVKSSADITGTADSLMLSIKNGYYQIIDSMQVDLNSQNIIQLQPNLNFLVNYKLLTSLSQDDLNKIGGTIGFYPDTSNTINWSSSGANVSGDGFFNNTINNTGLSKRKELTSTKVDSKVMTNLSLYGREGRNYFVSSDTAAENKVYTFYILATIRLKDLSDWFNKVPIMKGSNYRFLINYNSCTTTITNTLVGDASTVVISSYNQLSGRTSPFIVSSFSATNPNAGMTAGVITIQCGIVKTEQSSISPFFKTCRLYVPAYKIDPEYEKNLIQSNLVSSIKYLDYYTYTIENIGSQNPMNQILTNGIVNPKLLIIIPFANTTSGINALNIPTYQSVFDSAPGTTTPRASIINFQVLLAGENVFNIPQDYTYSQFLDEFQHINAINGSIDNGINSGLIGLSQWNDGYRFYVCDLSRRLKYEDEIPKSVQVLGVNNTSISMNYVCFILYEKHLKIKTSTGEIVP